ncbi:GNAT family N-acetyltransferase [Shewanella pealeana]|uniref:GCN5-related N-acetyltransferase n=1 Tax=Shewanella pealeana (strain ATCC 700345 / ANG-SQ1) TaxID=398579 RepID=A8H4P1_SHEPA|nr:GNAT family N-acetyltransferase [Shewanella pealeana]ABV87528.1 GCN5-related N-acetyltransferase [Shewanella pealeana ATCC 700345]
MEIRQATQNDLTSFFSYLNDHLSDNGDGETQLFQPMSKVESSVNAAMKSRFTAGINTEIFHQGWRRLWLAFDDNKKIVGHIDIRGHAENHTKHRVLLGMGVDRSVRRFGIGKQLINQMLEWVADEPLIEFIDLWVLSNNLAAQKLYISTGFQKCGEIKDMFKIDGKSLSYTVMSRATVIAHS